MVDRNKQESIDIVSFDGVPTESTHTTQLTVTLKTNTALDFLQWQLPKNNICLINFSENNSRGDFMS